METQAQGTSTKDQLHTAGEQQTSYPLGMDISRFQGAIDWDKVAHSGLSFAFAKVTEGTSYTDPDFAANWAGMEKADLLRGAYHFYRPGMDPIAQANHFLKSVPALGRGDLHPMLDVEVADGVSAAGITAGVQQWIEHVSAVLHRDVIIYTYIYFWQHNMKNTSRFAQTCPLWIAHYTSARTPTLVGGWPFWTFWQYTDKGSVDGIEGIVDKDRFNGPLANLRKFAGY